MQMNGPVFYNLAFQNMKGENPQYLWKQGESQQQTPLT